VRDAKQRSRREFVSMLVHQGRFKSEEAAVVEGMRLLMSQEKLRSEIRKGVEQLDKDQWFDEETVFDEVNAEIAKIESKKQES
jgi:Arc/MetJ-type ribon-helix-helix transcriptional regulator